MPKLELLAELWTCIAPRLKKADLDEAHASFVRVEAELAARLSALLAGAVNVEAGAKPPPRPPTASPVPRA